MRRWKHKISAAAAHYPPLTQVLLILHPWAKSPGLLPGLLWGGPHCFSASTLASSNPFSPLQPMWSFPNTHLVTLLLHWPLIGLPRKPNIFNGGPQDLSSACLSSLISWQSPLWPLWSRHASLSCPPTLLHPSHPITEPWHLLYHLLTMFFLPPGFFCLVNSYTCLRCQFKC